MLIYSDLVMISEDPYRKATIYFFYITIHYFYCCYGYYYHFIIVLECTVKVIDLLIIMKFLVLMIFDSAILFS